MTTGVTTGDRGSPAEPSSGQQKHLAGHCCLDKDYVCAEVWGVLCSSFVAVDTDPTPFHQPHSNPPLCSAVGRGEGLGPGPEMQFKMQKLSVHRQGAPVLLPRCQPCSQGPRRQPLKAPLPAQPRSPVMARCCPASAPLRAGLLVLRCRAGTAQGAAAALQGPPAKGSLRLETLELGRAPPSPPC